MENEWFTLDWFKVATLTSFVWKNPYYLYAIVGIPLLFLFRWLFSPKRQVLYLALPPERRQTHWSSYFRFLIPITFSAALFCILLALARPQRILESKEQYAEGIDIMLALDVSGSMGETDLQPTRLEAAKQVAREFIKGRQNDRIGLVVFAGEPLILSPLTTDYATLNAYIDEIYEGMIPVDGTSLGTALATCINHLRDVPSKSKVTILLSDGDSKNDVLPPINAADLANFFSIRLYTIAVGRDSDQEIVNEKTLREIAKEGKGAFFRATDNETLTTIFKQVNRMEKAKIERETLQDVRDYYYIYIYWAIVLLLITLLLKNTALGNILED